MGIGKQVSDRTVAAFTLDEILWALHRTYPDRLGAEDYNAPKIVMSIQNNNVFAVRVRVPNG